MNRLAKKMGEKPISYLFFNRPDYIRYSFEAIREYKPEKLFLISDGPRDHSPSDANLVNKARLTVENMIDWPCDVKKYYSDNNLGCGKRISSGLCEVFKSVDSSIVIEDDCIANRSFFTFMESALSRYAENEKIMAISASPHPRGGESEGEASFKAHYTRYWSPWGWATWARTWRGYDFSMEGLEDWILADSAKNIIPSKAERQRIYSCMKRTKSGQIDTWDYQFLYLLWKTESLCLESPAPLVCNIGFGPNATHTTGLASPLSYRKTVQLKQINFPESFDENYIVERDGKVADAADSDLSIAAKLRALMRRILWKLSSISRYR